MTPLPLPHWDLSNVYPGLDSPELARAMADVKTRLDEIEAYFTAHGLAQPDGRPAGEPAVLAQTLNGALDHLNALDRLFSTVWAYLMSFVATDSYNDTARRLYSQLQMLEVRMQQHFALFQAWLGKGADVLPEALQQPGAAQAHAFFLKEAAAQSRYLMTQAEEALAAELGASGAQAWSKLQGTICSQLTVPFERNGRTETLPLPALQNIMHHDPVRDTRRRAYEAELAALESVREPLAACLNGIKGAVSSLNRRRGRTDALHASLEASRMDRETLQAMLDAIRDSFPVFRRYLKKKAARLGVPALAWYDLMAPVTRNERRYTWPEAEQFIAASFGTFSSRLADFARQAFDRRWVDAEPRNGKRGGAFCMGLPAVDESRVLMNFDGSFDQVSTLAHELGHAFHNLCRVGKTELQKTSPLTLSETASIFCETILIEAALRQAAGPEEQLAILETELIGTTQVIVDIYSRYLFETEVFQRREQAELSADELCEIMLRAQEQTYGDGLDPNLRHKYMWTWKSHYYGAQLSFYNYPYAFGLLFGTGLYALYQQRGPAFVDDYTTLLAGTGEATVADLAARFGIDLRGRTFWENSLQLIGRRIERYLEL